MSTKGQRKSAPEKVYCPLHVPPGVKTRNAWSVVGDRWVNECVVCSVVCSGGGDRLAAEVSARTASLHAVLDAAARTADARRRHELLDMALRELRELHQHHADCLTAAALDGQVVDESLVQIVGQAAAAAAAQSMPPASVFCGEVNCYRTVERWGDRCPEHQALPVEPTVEALPPEFEPRPNPDADLMPPNDVPLPGDAFDVEF